MKTITINILVAAAISLLLIWGTTGYRQWTQYQRGEQALAKGENVAAIAAFDSAIHMYTPGSPMGEKAAQQLWSLAERLEKGGEPDLALIAYRSLRSSFYAVRWIYQPGSDWIERCDTRIAALVPAREALRQRTGM